MNENEKPAPTPEIDDVFISADWNPDVPQPITSQLTIYGDTFSKLITIPAMGTYVGQHSHSWDHPTWLISGALRVWLDGVPLGDFEATQCLKIPAFTKHQFMALVPNTQLICIHAEQTFEEVEEGALPKVYQSGPPALRDDGITFRITTIDEFLAIDSPLYYSNMVMAGKPADSWKDLNWALMRRLESQGILFGMAAWKESELLGYTMSIVSPSLHALGHFEALQTLFHFSPDVPGLGLRLQRATLVHLQSLGVADITFRAGNKNPRLSSVFRRLGAVSAGEIFLLKLKE